MASLLALRPVRRRDSGRVLGVEAPEADVAHADGRGVLRVARAKPVGARRLEVDRDIGEGGVQHVLKVQAVGDAGCAAVVGAAARVDGRPVVQRCAGQKTKNKGTHKL